MIKRELIKCTQCDEPIPKNSHRSWPQYLLQRFCSQNCANKIKSINKAFRIAKPIGSNCLTYRDYLKKHADQF